MKKKLKRIIKYIFFPWSIITEKENLFVDYKYYTKGLSERNLKFLLRSNLKYVRKNNSELKKIRQKIVKNYLLNEDQVNILNSKRFLELESFKTIKKKINKLSNFEIIKCEYYKISHYGVINHFQKRKKKLLVYIEGHGNKSPQDRDHYLKIEKKVKQKGYDVLNLCMSGHGFNYCKTEDFNFPGKIKNTTPFYHQSFASYKDKKNPTKKPLSLMLSGNYFLIKHIIEKYKYSEVIISGFSGGGWLTTLLGSFYTNIKKTISVAGTIPLIFKVNRMYLGDWEQNESDIYDFSDYIDWYELCTLDKKFRSTRTHVQIFNNKEPKTTDGIAANKLKSMIKINNFKVVISKNNKHSIIVEDFMKFL